VVSPSKSSGVSNASPIRKAKDSTHAILGR
jgi:hypothetical protein